MARTQAIIILNMYLRIGALNIKLCAPIFCDLYGAETPIENWRIEIISLF